MGTGSKDGTHILGKGSKDGAQIGFESGGAQIGFKPGKGSKDGAQIRFGVSSSPQDAKGPKAIKLTTHTNAIKIVLKVVFICPS